MYYLHHSTRAAVSRRPFHDVRYDYASRVDEPTPRGVRAPVPTPPRSCAAPILPRSSSPACPAASRTPSPRFSPARRRIRRSVVHDARRHRRVSLEDYEAAGGALTLGDVGRDAVDACVDTINRQCGRAVARASTREGEALDAEKIRASGARAVALRCGAGALSEACAMAEACKSERATTTMDAETCARALFAHARARATTGCVFVDDGRRGIEDAVRGAAAERHGEIGGDVVGVERGRGRGGEGAR